MPSKYEFDETSGEFREKKRTRRKTNNAETNTSNNTKDSKKESVDNDSADEYSNESSSIPSPSRSGGGMNRPNVPEVINPTIPRRNEQPNYKMHVFVALVLAALINLVGSGKTLSGWLIGKS